MATYLRLELDGDPGARGIAYGRAAKNDILANISTYKQRFARGGLAWGDARTASRTFLPAIEAFAPDLLTELEAIAMSAGVELDDLLVLNARTSLIYNLTDDCTSIALVPKKNDRCDVLGQNWDNMERLRPVLLRVTAPGQPILMTLTEAGTLAKIGFNEAGVGVCVNGLGRPGSSEVGSVPLFVFLRRLLGMRTLEAAQDLVLTHHRDAPHNFLIASQAEGAADIETLYAEAEILAMQSGGVLHTNHVLDARLRAIDSRTPSQNSLIRFRRAAELLSGGGAEDRSPERMLAILSDHADEPDSICRHRPTTKGGFQVITKHAVVMDLGTMEMRISDGPPCSSRMDTYTLSEPLVAT
ncbi:hypothetical protein KAR02_12990 [Candidatus Bipolaricaulota bacterium]|nr:hypothetical protein [Candidatus Bipolaricaulota bacterium]